MLITEVWIFIFGNIIAGTAHTLRQLVAGRLISGVGAAGLLSLVTIIVSRTFIPHLPPKSRIHATEFAELTHERQRSQYLNLINAVFIVADSSGPIIGGALAKSGNWRWM